MTTSYSDFSKEDEAWKDKQLMLKLYDEEGYTYAEIADLVECTDGTVANWMKKHKADEISADLDVRIPDEYPYRDKALMETLYLEEQLSSTEIAAVLGCSTGAVMEWLKKHGIQTRSRSDAVSIASGGSKDLYFYTMKRRGYEAISTVTENLYIHRLQAVAYFGFEAVAENHVHHKNEIPWCNTEWNLELLDPNSHSQHHNGPENTWLDRLRAAEMYREEEASSYDVAEVLDVTASTAMRWAREVDPRLEQRGESA